jgi:hypothetical protein
LFNKKVKEAEVFIFALLGSMTIGLLFRNDINIVENTWHWTFSTIFQGIATLLGLVAIFLVYRLQIVGREVESSIKSLREVVYGGENLSVNDLLRYAKDQISGLEEEYKDELERHKDYYTKEIIDIELKLNRLREEYDKYNSKTEFREKIKDNSRQTIAILTVILLLSLYFLPVVTVGDNFPTWLIRFRPMTPYHLSGFIGGVMVAIIIVAYRLSELLKDKDT